MSAKKHVDFEKIIEKVVEGHTLADACKMHGIAYRTFYRNVKADAQLAEAYKKVREEVKEIVAEETREAIMPALKKRLIEGDWSEQITEHPDGTFTKTTTRKSAPAGLLIFALKKYHPEIFGDDIQAEEIEAQPPSITITPSKQK